MSSAISTYQVLDDRLAISDSVNFGVAVGGQSINQQVFNAQTQGTSAVTLNCLIPSLQTVIDRHILLRTTLSFTITGTVHSVGDYLINYPTNLALSPFPFSQLVNTLSVQINNTTTNSNYQDTLNCMLRQMSPEQLAKYSDLTPIQQDYYQQLQTVGNLSPFKSILEANDYKVVPRGSWVLDSITGNTVAAGADAAKTVTVVFSVTEPIFCSPFLFGDTLDEHNSGLSGVSSINFNFNLGNIGRAIGVFKQEVDDVITNVAFNGCSNTSILMTFLSPKPSQLIPLTCALPYYELNAYKTTGGSALAAGASTTITSSIVSPNCIPDKVYLFIRPIFSNDLAAAGSSARNFPISNVNITWNTQSGILASAQPQDLYYMSKKAGLKMDYPSWNGQAGGAGVGADGATPLALAGGIVVLDFNANLPIMEQYYSSSSLGMWSFQVTATFKNNTAAALVGSDYELVVVFFQSGVFQTTSGSSSQYVGVLSKDEVLRVAQEEPHLMTEHHRMVGGGLGSWLSSAIKSSSPALKSFVLNQAKAALPAAASALKAKLADSSSKMGQLGATALGALGYGRPRTRQ